MCWTRQQYKFVDRKFTTHVFTALIYHITSIIESHKNIFVKQYYNKNFIFFEFEYFWIRFSSILGFIYRWSQWSHKSLGIKFSWVKWQLVPEEKSRFQRNSRKCHIGIKHSSRRQTIASSFKVLWVVYNIQNQFRIRHFLQ